MTRLARLDDLRRLGLLLLGLGMLTRALVPTGWMPTIDADGVRLVLCSGWQDVAPATAPASGHHGSDDKHQMAAGHGDGHGDGEQGKKADHSAPCTYAASALNAPLPSGTVALLFWPMVAFIASAFNLVTIGKGLAAPPPPSTGPPSIS